MPPAPRPSRSLLEPLFRWRGLVVLGLLLAALLAAWGGSALRFDFTPQRIFESDDPAFAALVAQQGVFGRDDSLLVAHLQADEVFSPAVVAHLRALHERLAAVDGVEGVDDLTTWWSVPPGQPFPAPLLPADPTPAGLAFARARALSEPLVRDRLVAADGRAALLLVRIDPGRSGYGELAPVVHGCLDALALPPPPGVEVLPTGIPLCRVLIVERLVRDQLLFIPLCTALFVAILWWVFRDLRAVFVPLLGVGLALLYTVGLLGATGQEVNIVNQVLPTLLFVIGMSDAIHLIARYRRELAGGLAQRPALRETMQALVVACFLTSVTTAVGFASLGVADMTILRRFGLYSAAGVMVAYAVTIVFVPLAFSYLAPIARPRDREAGRRGERAALALARFVARRRGPVLVGALLVTAGSVLLALRVDVESHLFEAFPDSDPVVTANRRIERDFAGLIPVALVVSWDEDGDELTPAVLAYLAELEALALEHPHIRGALSLLDLLREWNAARHGGDPAWRRLPASEAEARQGLAVVRQLLAGRGGGDLLGRIYAPEARLLRLTFRADDIGAQATEAALAPLEARLLADAARQRALGIRVVVGGEGPVAARGMGRLIRDLLLSLLTAFAIILATMCLLVRSLRAGLVSMIPNVFPLLLTFGFMGLVGMELRVTSVLVFTISLGLAVDDTIHFMARFREEWQRRPRAGPGGEDVGLAYRRAIQRTFVGTGTAIVATSVLLGGGLAVLLLSSFPLTRTFALCLEVTVLGALIGDLLILPACLELLRPFR